MLNRKKISTIIVAALAVMMVLGAFSGAFAIAERDMEKPVSLTIKAAYNGTPIVGTEFTLYYLADMTLKGDYIFTEDFKSFSIEGTLNASESRAMAKDVNAYIALHPEIKSVDAAVTDDNGTASFPAKTDALKQGLYLATGTKYKDEEKKEYVTEAFLVSLPDADEEGSAWVYDVTALPKYEYLQDKPYTPPDIPQTGQEWMPAVIMAAGGIVLILSGLVSMKKKHE